jgi:hypothetical protein
MLAANSGSAADGSLHSRICKSDRSTSKELRKVAEIPYLAVYLFSAHYFHNTTTFPTNNTRGSFFDIFAVTQRKLRY